jgi:hypothetical protein
MIKYNRDRTVSHYTFPPLAELIGTGTVFVERGTGRVVGFMPWIGPVDEL